MTKLRNAQISTLTAILDGSAPTRAASTEAAAKRFRRVAEARGIMNHADILGMEWRDAADFCRAYVRPAPTPAFQPEATDAIEAALADFHSSDTRSDAYMRELFARLFAAGAKSAAPNRKPRQAGPTKSSLAIDLLTRPEGCTSKDILAATGWPSVSVPALARSAKLTLRQEKEGRGSRYFATAA